MWLHSGVLEDVSHARRCVAGMPDIRTFEPHTEASRWREFAERID
jgi:hypothetical protein